MPVAACGVVAAEIVGSVAAPFELSMESTVERAGEFDGLAVPVVIDAAGGAVLVALEIGSTELGAVPDEPAAVELPNAAEFR